MLAGPKVLEHLVDAVLTFEGDRFASHRLLRAVKNRFGATHELGVFEMRDRGLLEVSNPSELFLGSPEGSVGMATIVACEGTRSLVVDLQALVNVTSYASPRRTATGIGTNRLHQILAVLEKHMGLPLSRFDCYLAVAGGLEVEEPAADLGVAAAVVASFRDLTLPAGTVLIGELGLGGSCALWVSWSFGCRKRPGWASSGPSSPGAVAWAIWLQVWISLFWRPTASPRPWCCLLYTSPSPRDATLSRMPSSA